MAKHRTRRVRRKRTHRKTLGGANAEANAKANAEARREARRMMGTSARYVMSEDEAYESLKRRANNEANSRSLRHKANAGANAGANAEANAEARRRARMSRVERNADNMARTEARRMMGTSARFAMSEDEAYAYEYKKLTGKDPPP